MPAAAIALWLAIQAVQAAPQQQEPAPTFQPTVAAGQTLELAAYWAPAGKSLYGLFRTVPALNAPQPAQSRRAYVSDDFRLLLPAEPVELGAVWRVPDAASLTFLRQFHPGVPAQAPSFGETPGTWAMLRAAGPDAFEILLRAHAAFQLDGGAILKPAQFEGRLVLGRQDGALRSFTLALPARDTNADLNVPLEGAQPQEGFVAMQADIGFVPRMELTSGPAAAPVWSREISLEAARLALRRAFYDFAALDWLPFDEAVQASRQSGKPLHLVLLFGCLDDDSC